MTAETRSMPLALVRPRLRVPGVVQEIARMVVFLLMVIVLSDLAIPRALVNGPSMEPTFFTDERLIISRMHYLVDEPHAGDIVVFNSLNPREVGVRLIKRVIGVPGDAVGLQGGQVIVNGVQLDEPYLLEACNLQRCRDQEWDLGPDEYFVMGDNRNHSNDSRAFGPVPVSHIVGQVVLRYWPLQASGVIGSVQAGGE
jgi:signal peptidase I